MFLLHITGFSASFWYAIWDLHSIYLLNNNHTSLRKRRASFHGFESFDNLSQCSTNLNLNDDSLCEDLNNSSHQSDHVFVNTVHRHHSLDYIVEKNMVDWFVKEANTIDEHSSFDLAVRAERYDKNKNITFFFFIFLLFNLQKCNI